MYSGKFLIMTSLALVMLSAIASAQDPSAQDQRAGQALAERLCARCHSIDSTSASPLEKAPPFRAIANRYSVWLLQEALAEGIVTGHAAMPEFVLSPDEIANLLTFMDSFTATDSKPR